MNGKIVALGGIPGSGKTTLMVSIMALLEEGSKSFRTEKVHDLTPAHVYDMPDGSVAYVLGVYDPDELFSGTDKMSMACQPKVVEFIDNLIRSEKKFQILFEGDRLFNGSFLNAMMERFEPEDMRVYILSAPTAMIDQRYIDRGSDQNEQFIRSRITKLDRLKTNMIMRSYTKMIDNEDMEQLEGNTASVLNFLYNS